MSSHDEKLANGSKPSKISSRKKGCEIFRGIIDQEYVIRNKVVFVGRNDIEASRKVVQYQI
jgi:hypothetical protein